MLESLNDERIGYVLQNMDNAVCLTANDGRLLYANPAAEKLFQLRVGGDTKIWDAIPYVEGNDALIQLFIDGVLNKRSSTKSLVEYFNNEGRRYDLHVSLTYEPGEEGAVLIVITDLSQVTRVRSALTRYTSPEIADFVLSTPEGEKQGGREEEVTILMSDLRGFSSISTRLSSNELIQFLNHYFEAMSAVISSRRGTIIEFLGDGIFVVFGAPDAMKDHASAAVHCAVEMQNAMADVNEWNREHHFPVLEMGIGINSGRVMVGNIGSDRRMKYGCIGEAVNIAGRLESFTIGGQILISENTRKLIEDPLESANEQTFLPKGSNREIKLYDVIGIGRDCSLRQPPVIRDWMPVNGKQILPFFILDGKTVSRTAHRGHLKKITKDRKYGVFMTLKKLKPLQNLLLRFGEEEAYAKVLGHIGKGYVLCFTIRPDSWNNLPENG